jgi:hypothetical protein
MLQGEFAKLFAGANADKVSADCIDCQQHRPQHYD